jgi:hypothetical protein
LGKICLLSTLILWALLFGYILSLLEGPAEIATNNELMQQRWFINILPWQEVLLIGAKLPTACMKNFLEYNALGDIITHPSQASSSVATLSLLGTLLLNLNIFDNETLTLLQDFTMDQFPNITLPNVPDVSNETSINDIFKSLQLYLEKCDDAAINLMEFAIDPNLYVTENELGITPDTINLADSLTFNWIRCWDNQILGGPNPWSPTKAQIDASANQSMFFREQWSIPWNAPVSTHPTRSLVINAFWVPR